MARTNPILEGPFSMVLSAALFGFVGYFVRWNLQTASGQTLLFMVLWVGTLRIGAVGFAVAAGMTFVRPIAANVLYGLLGAASAVMFLVIAALDVADQQRTIFAYAPVVLAAFAAWNGFSAWNTLREVSDVLARGNGTGNGTGDGEEDAGRGSAG